MMRSLLTAASALALLASANAASAQELLNVNVGLFEGFSPNKDWMGGLEYRGDYLWEGLRPNLGVFVTEEGSQYYYGGFGYDFFLNDSHSLIFTPNVAVGYYEDGGGKNLGGHVEFRSGLELAYAFENQHRLGVAVHHLSNAGIYDRNPGTETVTVQYSFPFSVFGN
jgi:lipid A 3-O-deacylase